MGRGRRAPETPYLAEEEMSVDGIDEWDCPTLPRTLKEKNLKRLANKFGYESEDSSEDNSEQGDHPDNEVPADVLLTGKAVRSEVKLKDLDKEDRAKFDKSMGKEWDSWQRFGAVEKLTKEQIEALPKDTKIIGTRWVHTDKNAKPRMLASYLAKRTGKSEGQIKREFPF